MVVEIDTRLENAVDHQIGHDRARCVVEGAPLLGAADHFGSRHPGQYGTGPIPVGDAMLRIDHDGRYRVALDQLAQGNAVVFASMAA